MSAVEPYALQADLDKVPNVLLRTRLIPEMEISDTEWQKSLDHVDDAGVRLFYIFWSLQLSWIDGRTKSDNVQRWLLAFNTSTGTINDMNM